MLSRKANVAVLVSGGGTNLQAIIDAIESGKIDNAQIAVVVADNSKALALERAKNHGITADFVSKKNCSSAKEFENKLLSVLEKNNIDLIVLAGFLSILSAEFCRRFANRIINVHPSLIPKYCGDGFYGLKVHQAVLSAKEKITGATVHFVNEITDGGKIIAQKEVKVKPNDTAETLQKRVMKEAEWIILPQAVKDVSQLILEGKI